MSIDQLAQECRHAALAVAVGIALIAPPHVDAQGSGTIAGVVSTPVRPRAPLRVTMDERVCGNELPDEAVVVDDGNHLANAVVTLAGVKAHAGTTGAAVVNERCRFSPRVQITRPNAAITTSSKDPILHTTNTSMAGGKGLFNVALPVPGITVTKALNGAGLVRVVCNTHPWMRGYIVVTEEMAAVSGADGTFMLKDVPAGRYELRIWHETLAAAPQNVTVTAGQIVQVQIQMR